MFCHEAVGGETVVGATLTPNPTLTQTLTLPPTLTLTGSLSCLLQPCPATCTSLNPSYRWSSKRSCSRELTLSEYPRQESTISCPVFVLKIVEITLLASLFVSSCGECSSAFGPDDLVRSLRRSHLATGWES